MPHLTPDEPDNPDAPAGRLRLLPPAVSFAARAAALYGVALPVAMLAASVTAGAVSSNMGYAALLNTTCCPPFLA